MDQLETLNSAVHIWHVDPDAVSVAHTAAGWLSPSERENLARVATDAGRQAYLVTRGLCRAALSHSTGVDPAAWRFGVGEFGKPRVESPAEFRSLRFNLTHTAGLIACAVSRAGEVGIDAEDCTRPVNVDEIARHFFSPAEREVLGATAAGERLRKFYEIWVVKEAYLKGRGTGLSVSPEDVTVRWDSRGEPLAIDGWRVSLHRRGPRHVAAVAVQTAADIRWMDGAPLLR